MAAFTETLTADGSTAVTAFQGEGTIFIDGNFGGGILTIEAQSSFSTNWIAQTDGAITADSVVDIKIGPCNIRFTLAGSTTPDLDILFVDNDVRKTSRLT
tara:strand:+ start:14638 stop:14937 length:300 start_codon:yes stop_codon:yes gene_type:complete